MPYIINKTNGEPLLTLNDGTLNTTTSVGLLGKNYVGYGETQNENFIHLLENFANASAPARPLEGQSWYNTSSKTLSIYTGATWVPVNSAIVSESEPASLTGENSSAIGNGVIWFKTSTKQLFLYNNGTWNLIGPNGIEGFGITDITAQLLQDTGAVGRPVLVAAVDNTPVAIFSKDSFEISESTPVAGFGQLTSGITLSAASSITGNLVGNSSTATRLQNSRTINGIAFNGTSDIVITSATSGLLNSGNYISGSNFNGSSTITWSVDAESTNSPNTVVARDATGNFSAGVITADISGTLIGNVNVATGTSNFNRVVAKEFIGSTLSGNAFSATKLQVSRKINGVDFDGTSDITFPVSGIEITGNRLSPTVVQSELTSLGRVNELRTQNNGIRIGSNDTLQLLIDQTQPVIFVNSEQRLRISIVDNKQVGARADFDFMPSDVALTAGGSNNPAFVGDVNSKSNLGLPTRTFRNVYAERFVGNADSATFAVTAESATNAVNAETATNAVTANNAITANTADTAVFASNADIANTAVTATSASTALSAQFSTTQPQGTNNTTIATTAYVQQEFTNFVAVPAGIIVMWSGAVVNVPSGWAICNGANGTPDLRNRFVVGAGNVYAPGNTGGSDTVVLSTANLPSHSHPGSTNDVSTDHAHAFNSTTNTEANHNHTITDPGHNHAYTQAAAISPGAGGSLGGGDGNLNTSISINIPTKLTGVSINPAGAHNHTVSGNTGGQSAPHGHTFTTDSTGNNSPIDVRPRYYALAYIMKI